MTMIAPPVHNRSGVTKGDRKPAPNRAQRFTSLVEKVKQIALQVGPGQKLPGVYELRDRMGVSIATLSRALDELEARQIIVRRNRIGIFASTAIHKRVIAIVCDPTYFRQAGASEFWDLLIKQAHLRADSSNELLEMHFISIAGGELELPTPLMTDVLSGRVSGVLFVGTYEDGVRWIEEHGVPVVVFTGPGTHRVSIDSEAFVSTGAERLARCGCRRIALWMPDRRVTSQELVETFQKQRDAAFRSGLKLGDAPYLPELVRNNQFTISTGPWTAERSMQEVGYSEAMATFRAPKETWPDGIVIIDDTLTVGALSAMRELGIDVGREVRIATSINSGSSSLIGWEGRLIPLVLDAGALAAAMFGNLDRLMDGELNVETSTAIGPTFDQSL